MADELTSNSNEQYNSIDIGAAVIYIIGEYCKAIRRSPKFKIKPETRLREHLELTDPEINEIFGEISFQFGLPTIYFDSDKVLTAQDAIDLTIDKIGEVLKSFGRWVN